MTAKKSIINLFRILGPIIFFYILSQIDYNRFLSELGVINWPYLVLAFVLLVICILFKALKWHAVLAALKITTTRLEAINLYWLGIFVGMITPGRVGELSKIYCLKAKGYNFFRSLFSLMFDRLSDVAIVLILGFIVSWYYLGSISVYIGLAGFLMVFLVFLFFLFNDQCGRFHRLSTFFISKIFPIDPVEYGRFTSRRLWQGIRSINKKQVFIFFFFMIFAWLVYFFARYAVALALDLPLSFGAIVITSVLIAIVTALPVSVAGLGTREAAVIYAFGLFGIDREMALIFSLLIFSLDLLVTSLGLISYLKESFSLNKIKQFDLEKAE